MSLAARMTRMPRAFDPDRGADAVAVGVPPEVRELLHGTAGSSPYLAGLITSEADWLPAACADPEGALRAVIDGVAELSVADLAPGLRAGKRRVALITALADLAGVWPLDTVTQALTDFAAAASHRCVTALVGAEIARGKLPGAVADDAATGGGMVVMAMGKMGAGELNYSSDIDLICLFDESRFDPDDYHDARSSFIRVTRKMTQVMGEVTQGGYVFRTDLRLRPDASVTPVCLSMEAAERYYESVGRTWERAAYIKANPVGGDLDAGARFLKGLTPFVWRKHLDFAAIEDAHDMRLRIRGHKGLGGPQALEGHNMKLGRGGIREIEFFTQTRQLIAGGRDPSLRVRGTVEGLSRLADAGWVAPGDAAALTEHYRAHREVEHRLQMIHDAQTHDLPTTPEGFDRLAALMGRDVAGMRAEIERRLDAVHHLTEGFFAPDTPDAPSPGVAAADWGDEITSRWPTYPALRSDRGSAIFERLRPVIMDKLASAAKPDEALAQFDGFLAGLPAGVQLFSLFEANPQLTQLIVDIAATAPALAQYLSRNAGVFDAVLGGSFFADWPGVSAMAADARTVIAQAPDYEAKLVAVRRWAKEVNFRIGVHHLRGLIDARQSGQQYADLAEACVFALLPAVVDEFAAKHGPPPGRGASVLGMGSLGSGMMTANSDLDIIVIYDPGEADASEGPRPLPVRPYYARLTQALVTALTAPMSEGRLYEVDMRLRPSGRQGPVATSLAAFQAYQETEAWTWEHLALTRARPIAGPAEMRRDVLKVINDVLQHHAQDKRILADLADMRARLATAKQARGAWDAKLGPGRLQDVELVAQAAALMAGGAGPSTLLQLDAGVRTGWLTGADADALKAAHDLSWRVQATGRLLTGDVLDPDALGAGGLDMLLRETGQGSVDALRKVAQDVAQAADQVISDKLSDGGAA